MSAQRRKNSQSLMTDAIRDVYADAPKEHVQVFCNKYVNAHFKEMRRQSNLPVKTLDRARDQLRNSQTCRKDITASRYNLPANWRVYIAVISVEELIKAHSTLLGETFFHHNYIDKLIESLRTGISKERIKAHVDLSSICGANLDIEGRFDNLVAEIELIRASEDRFASASRRDVVAALRRHEDVCTSFGDWIATVRCSAR